MSANHLTNSLPPKTAPTAVRPLQISNLASAAEAVRFLEYYGPAIESSLGRLGVFVLPDRLSFVSNDITELAEYGVKQALAGKDAYFHIHLHDLPQGESFTHGQIATVKSAIGLFSDIDARGPGRSKPLETLCPTVDDAIWVTQQFNELFAPLCTSALIVSGYGCYPHILFKEPFALEAPEDRRRVESVGRRFHAALHQIAAKRGWTGAVDYCDLAKVLRLPGCINWKDRTAPKRVQLQDENPARFNLSDLEEVLPQIQNDSRIFAASTGITTAAEVNITLNPAAEVSSDLLAAMAENHPLFATTWHNRRSDLKDQSASGYDMAIAGIGVACGLTDQQIADLIVHHRRNFSGKKQDRRGQAHLKYLQRTISRAREGKQSSESSERQRAELEDALKAGPVVGGSEDRAVHHVGNAAVTDEGPARGSGSQSANVPDGLPVDQAEKPESISRPNSSQENGNSARTGCTQPMEFVLAKVRKTGSVEPVYQHIDLLAGLSEAELAIAYQHLKSALGTKLNSHHFNKAIKDARNGLRRKNPQPQIQDPRVFIQTHDRLLDEIAADAIAALERANDPPTVFLRGGHLVMIRPDEEDRPVIIQANGPMMRGRLARVAGFLKETKQGPLRVSPPEDLTLDVLSANEGAFPPLGVVTQIPILRPDGTVRLETGYDPITRAYYHTSPSFKLGSIPDTPDRSHVDTAVQFLDEAIGEFPFETLADKANCIALMLTPILKVAFRMKSPLALIDAPKWGTGKSLLASVVYVLTTGSEGVVCAAPTSEEEWRKRMTSILERGSAVVIIDNVNQTLQSPSLSAVLTTSSWEDRRLGKSEDIRLPNVSTWIATGNNIALGGEMARRGYRIRLDAKVSNPSRRTGFKRNDQELPDWVTAHRGELVTALLTIIRAWWAAGKPKGDVPAFGSFNNWARVLGGILSHAGVNGFLKNLDAVQQESDEESRQWEQFLHALAIVFRRSEFTTAEIVDRALHQRDLLSSSIPDEIHHPDESSNAGASLQKRLGKALGRKCGTRFGELELRLERCEPEKHTKVQRWRVEGDLDSLLSSWANQSAGFHSDE